MTDEQQIRELIERWAAAAHDGDMPAVLADHAPDIVMFDVPAPEQGVRGLDAYRKTWPGFFEWRADATAPPEISDSEIRAVHEQWFESTAAKDLDRLMAHIASDVVSYEHGGRLQYIGIDDVRDVCQRGLDFSRSQIDFDIPDLTIRVAGNLAVTWGLDRIVADGVESRSRGTRISERRDGEWQMIHQHLSVQSTNDQHA